MALIPEHFPFLPSHQAYQACQKFKDIMSVCLFLKFQDKPSGYDSSHNWLHQLRATDYTSYAQLTTPVTRNCLCQLCDYFVERCGGGSRQDQSWAERGSSLLLPLSAICLTSMVILWLTGEIIILIVIVENNHRGLRRFMRGLSSLSFKKAFKIILSIF